MARDGDNVTAEVYRPLGFGSSVVGCTPRADDPLNVIVRYLPFEMFDVEGETSD